MVVSTDFFKTFYSNDQTLTPPTSRFFITLDSCEHLNGKHTVFGRVVSGQDTLQRIAKVDVDKNDRPLEPVLVSRCGELEKKKKKAAPPAEPALVSQSRDRGRKRRSGDSDVEMENSPEPRKPPKSRRQSDNMVDEGLRGRPRQRSGSRSPSKALSSHTESEESNSDSPARRHKRKRSPSPSRHTNHDGYERRRRSLPNQYRDERFGKVSASEDDDRYKPSPRRNHDRQDGQRWQQENDRHRKDDRYRPAKDRNPHADDGRLGGGGHDDHDPPVKFKGRGVMKYREPERQW